MNKDQADVLNIVQEVLRVLTVSLAGMDPANAHKAGLLIAAGATHKGLTPTAAAMLQDIGTVVSTLSKPAAPPH